MCRSHYKFSICSHQTLHAFKGVNHGVIDCMSVNYDQTSLANGVALTTIELSNDAQLTSSLGWCFWV